MAIVIKKAGDESQRIWQSNEGDLSRALPDEDKIITFEERTMPEEIYDNVLDAAQQIEGVPRPEERRWGHGLIIDKNFSSENLEPHDEEWENGPGSEGWYDKISRLGRVDNN